MKLDYAFFASNAEITVDGRLNVFGGEFSGLNFPAFPAAAQMCLVARLFDRAEEVGTHKVSIACDLRDSGPLPGHFQELPVETKTNRLDAAANAGAIVIVQIMMEFPRAGVYDFELSVDGERLKTIALYVSALIAEKMGRQAQPAKLAK